MNFESHSNSQTGVHLSRFPNSVEYFVRQVLELTGCCWSSLYSHGVGHSESMTSNSSSIITCWFADMETCLLHHCLAMATCFCSTIPAFSCHATICTERIINRETIHSSTDSKQCQKRCEMEAQITHCAIALNGETECYNYQKSRTKSKKLNRFLYPMTATNLCISYMK
jgi:hypothetical protein